MSTSFNRLVTNCATEALSKVCRSMRFTAIRAGYGSCAGAEAGVVAARVGLWWSCGVELGSFNESVR